MKKFSFPITMRIIALASGFIPALFFLLFLIGEALAELFDGKPGVLPIFILMIFTVSGYILAWKRARTGGVIMVSGGLLMGIYLLIASGFTGLGMAAAYSLPFILPGGLLLTVRSKMVKKAV